MLLSQVAVDTHVDLAQSLDENLVNRRFWISLQVLAAGEEPGPEVCGELVERVEEWLWSLADADSPSPVERQFEIEPFLFSVRATERSARAQLRGGTILANPYPAFAYWSNA